MHEAKTEIDNTTIIVGNFNNPLSIMGRAVRQKINKEIKDEQNYKPTILSRHQ